MKIKGWGLIIKHPPKRNKKRRTSGTFTAENRPTSGEFTSETGKAASLKSPWRKQAFCGTAKANQIRAQFNAEQESE
jgi:hypothetical protein